MLRVSWIGGWGVDPQTLHPLASRCLPTADHSLFAPVPSAPGSVAESDCVIAWSLGAWRVLNAAAGGLRFKGRVFLLAPFIAFCSDYGLGGRCSRSQVRWLKRWIQREPQAALGDFYSRANLDHLPRQLPYSLPDLLEGLEVLEQPAPESLRQFVHAGLPDGWKAAIGSQDSLLEPELIMRSLNGCVLVEGGTHSPGTLLPALKRDLDAI